MGLIDFIHEVDGSGGCSLYMPGGGSLHPATQETVEKRMHYVHQDGQAVFKFAVRKQAETLRKDPDPQRPEGQRYRYLHSAPGQPADHHGHGRPSGHEGRKAW